MARQLRTRMQDWSISLIASLALTAVVTVVLLVFAILYYNAETERRMEELHQQLAASADQLAIAVALPAWNFDDTQIMSIMRSGLNARDLYGSVVAATANRHQYVLQREPDGNISTVAALRPSAGLLEETRTIRVAGQDIGTLRLYATTEFVRQELQERRIAIVGAILVLDVVLVAVLYVLLWFLMLKPVRAVGQYAASVKAGRGDGTAPNQSQFYGELKDLNESIQEMVALLDRRYHALRASEERLSMATHAASIGIWDWDLVNGQQVWDEEMYRQYKLDPHTTVLTEQAWQDCLHPEDRMATQEAINRAIHGEGEYACEFRVIWPDGTVRHLKADSITFRDMEGRALRMVGVNYDITEQKKAEAELLRHRNHLEELVAARTEELEVAVTEAKAANRAKSVFLATMSHELRTPLNSVIGFSRMMANSASMSEEERRNLSIIHRSGQHLLTLINDILELSKIEAGRVVLQPDVIDPADLVQEVVDMVRPKARQNGIGMDVDCAKLPEAIRADGAKLRQVLLNLISNAVKFAQEGNVTLRVRSTSIGDRRERISFAVSDTGIGIAQADQERIFDPFVQAEGIGAKDGTGLGLAISREFVRLMGGVLKVESVLGEGSTFSFSIEVELASGKPVRHLGEDVELDAGQRGRSILVVDDNADGRRLLANMLGPLGFRLHEAVDGEDGLNAVRSKAPDLVFMDWRMPGLDGLEATRRMRADSSLRQPRVVMLTASAFEEEKREALAAGADAFLRKPVDHDELYVVLEQQLGIQFTRRARQPEARAVGVGVEELRRIPAEARAALRTALQELNVMRATQILAPLRADHAELADAIAQMMARHQYPALCALLDEAEEAV